MSYAGFDRLDYPGIDTMTSLIQTNFRWCGYYLAPAPNRSYSAWMNNYQALAALGWGFAPVFVGQQQYDPNKPYSTILTPEQGTADAQAAVNLMQTEGFPAGSVIFLDVESGGPIQQEMYDYAAAWQTSVANSGYRPGIYCSHLVVDGFKANGVAAGLVFWTFRLPDVNPHVYAALFPEYPTSDSGKDGMLCWQYAQGQFGTSISWDGGNSTLDNVDMDTSEVPDPSQPPNPWP